jgi:hypothetical protein
VSSSRSPSVASPSHNSDPHVAAMSCSRTARLGRSSPAQTPRPTSPSRWHDQRRNDGLLRRSRVADEVDRVSLAGRFVMSALASPRSRSRVASASKARSHC